MPQSVAKKSKHEVKQWAMQQAAELVEVGECSYRVAVELLRSSYGINVSVGALHSCRHSPDHQLQPKGRPQIMPVEFTDKLVQWICAKRALRFPVFRDDVLAVANCLIKDTTFANKFKHNSIDVKWYYRMLDNYSHVLGTANQRPLEIDRARWATAANVKEWYNMLADILIDTGIARKNPDFDPNADAKSRKAEPILIIDPDRMVSFDETRVEMDMTKASKSKSERILVDKTTAAANRCETLAHKGGMCGTAVGGSTASGKALRPLIIFSGGGLRPEMCTPSPDCDFYNEQTDPPTHRRCTRPCSPRTRRGASTTTSGCSTYVTSSSPCSPT